MKFLSRRTYTLLSTIILGSVFFSQVVSADLFSGGRTSGIFEVYYDKSVSNYGYTTIYDDAYYQWNGITAKVSLSKTTSTTNYPDKYYVGETSTPGLLGQMTPYKKDSNGNIVKASLDETWLYSTVAIYDNTMDSANMTRAERVGNATHEVGHTLSLAHPSIVVESIMNQGIQDIAPTTYDKDELRRKWGK